MVPDLPYAAGVPDTSGTASVRRGTATPTRAAGLPARVGRCVGAGLRIGTATALAVAVTAALAVPSAHGDDLDQQRKKLDRELSAQKSDLDGSSRALSRATAALTRAEASLETARKALAGTRTVLATAQRNDRAAAAKLAARQRALDQAEAAVVRGEAELAAQRRLIARQVGEQYQKQTTLMPFALLAQSGSLADFQSRVQMASTMLDASQVEFERLTTLQAALEKQRTRQADLENQVAVERVAAAKALTATTALEQRAAEQTAAVAALVRSRRTAGAAAARAVAADRRAYASLERESAAVSRRIAARIARDKAARARQQHSDPASSHHGFVYPVDGAITSAYGMRLHPVLHVWKLHDGTDFGAGCGAPIRAAYAGRVVERYDNAGYGKRLMIDHGRVDGRYVTTGYNHAVRYVVGFGQHVRRGQVVGYVGETGYATGCHLHLMVWLDGALVNPMTWY